MKHCTLRRKASVVLGLLLTLPLVSCSKKEDIEVVKAQAEAAVAKAELARLKAEAAAAKAEAELFKANGGASGASEAKEPKETLPKAKATSASPAAPSAMVDPPETPSAKPPASESFAVEQPRFQEPPALSHIPTAGGTGMSAERSPTAGGPTESPETKKRIAAIDTFYTARYGEPPSVQINEGNYVKYDSYADGFRRALNGEKRPESSEPSLAQGWDDGDAYKRTNVVPSLPIAH